jgi:exopolysaccharide biosynthesis polyprenyl glycosylphosphotransferase
MTKLFGHSVRSHVLLLYLAETVACFVTVWLLLRSGIVPVMPSAASPKDLALLALLALSTGIVTSAAGLYQAGIWRRLGRLLLGCAVAAGLLFLLAHVVLALIEPSLDGAAHWNALGLVLAGLVSAMMATHLTFALAARRGLLRQRLAVLSDAGPLAADRPLAVERRGGDWSEEAFEVALAAPPEAAAAEAFSPAALRARRIWGVIVGDPAAVPGERIAAWKAAGLRVLTTDEFAEQRTTRVDLSLLRPGWLEGQGSGGGWLQDVLRRGLDIAGSLCLLLFTLPLLLVTAAAIRLDSPGPVLYRQERVGRGGRVFTLYKFRSMRVDAEAAGAPRWASRRDDRVTRVGRLIRLTRIDEIPQALNVLAGDMSLVGPRPERPAFVEQLSRAIPHYDDRAVVRPGITGWAQVNYPYGASVEDARMKLAYDLYYVKHRSLFLDLLILVATVRVVLFQEGSR